jgi:hypothetical protein
MDKSDLPEIALLALCETIMRQLLLKSRPHSYKYNQIKGMLAKLENIDKTYTGHLPDDYAKVCEELLGGIQEQLDKVLEAV